MEKIRKVFLIVILIPVVYGVIVAAYYWATDFYENRPKVESELLGIKLGDNYKDVTFKIGNLWQESNNKSSQNYGDDGVYFSGNIMLQIAKGRVELIVYTCKAEHDYSSLSNISCGSNGSYIEQRFGSDLKIFCRTGDEISKENILLRMYRIEKYNLAYYLTKNEVTDYSIVDSSYSLSNTWVDCK